MYLSIRCVTLSMCSGRTFTWNDSLSKTWKLTILLWDIFISKNTFFVVVANWLSCMDSGVERWRSRIHKQLVFDMWRKLKRNSKNLLYIKSQNVTLLFRSFLFYRFLPFLVQFCAVAGAGVAIRTVRCCHLLWHVVMCSWQQRCNSARRLHAGAPSTSPFIHDKWY